MTDRFRQFADRCREFSGSGFVYFRRDGFRGLLSPQKFVAPHDFFALLDDFARTGETAKNSRSVRAAILGDAFVKCYKMRSLLHRCKRAFQTPRPLRCLRIAEHLRRAGLDTPQVYAATERRDLLLPRESYLVTATIPADCRFLPGLPVDRHREAVIGFVATMHRAGVAHGDLNLRNLYANGDFSRLGVIDLDGAGYHPGGVPVPLRRRELARLISSYLREDPSRDFTEQTRQWSECYRQLTGIDLAGAELNQRVDYLARRIRKK